MNYRCGLPGFTHRTSSSALAQENHKRGSPKSFSTQKRTSVPSRCGNLWAPQTHLKKDFHALKAMVEAFDGSHAATSKNDPCRWLADNQAFQLLPEAEVGENPVCITSPALPRSFVCPQVQAPDKLRSVDGGHFGPEKPYCGEPLDGAPEASSNEAL